MKPRTCFLTAAAISTLGGLLAVATPARAVEFCNTTPVIGSSGASLSVSSPYPSSITVSGLTGTVTDVNVRLLDFKTGGDNEGLHWAEDTDVLLVAPNGANIVPMSDVGGDNNISKGPVVDADITLDDQAPNALPADSPITSGTFRPVDDDDEDISEVNPVDTFPAPAPSPSGSFALATFNGINPNGTWNLYVVDDTAQAANNFNGGWCIDITTTGGATPTPTPSPTPPEPTPTPTPTPTPSATPGATPSPTPTPSATPSATPGATPSPTPSATPSGTPAQSLNISTRLRVETGDKVLIGGFIVQGSVPKPLLLRGLGPSLNAFGISNVLLDPFLELRGPDGLIMTNDNWTENPQRAQFEGGPFQPSDNREAVVLATVPAEHYTVILSGVGGTTGIGLMEVYDRDPATNSELGNISTRGFVQTGENVMIGGFILGDASANADVVVRGIGPSLVNFGVTNFLADPILELRNQNGTLLVANDDWADDPVSAAQLTAVGLAPQHPDESAIFTSLSPGQFTAILAGKDGSIGIGLVEIYNLR